MCWSADCVELGYIKFKVITAKTVQLMSSLIIMAMLAYRGRMIIYDALYKSNHHLHHHHHHHRGAGISLMGRIG